MTRAAARAVVAVLALAATAVVVGPSPAAAADPTVVVTPGADLLDGQPVSVSIGGLAPGQPYRVSRCAGPDAAIQCAERYVTWNGYRPYGIDPTDVADVVAGADGTATVDLLLYRGFQVFHDIVDVTGPVVGEPGTEVDCSVDACTIAVFADDLDGERVAEAPITMSAEGSYQWPEASITVAPTTVVDRSTVTVSASGFSPWFAIPWPREREIIVHRQTCVAGADPDIRDCEAWSSDPADGALFLLRADGSLAPSAHVVRRHVVTPNGPVDCAVVGCTFALAQGSGPTSARLPLTFGPEWAPWPSVSHFLSQAVAPVRGRPLTDPERADLAGRLGARTTEGVDALIDAARAGAGQGGSTSAAVAEVTRTYWAFFRRSPETAGLQYWVGRLRAGMAPNTMARSFGGTPEFRRTYGAASDAQVVERAYQNTLGRSPDAAGAAFWQQQLAAGLSRAGLIYRFGRSAEFQAREGDRVALTIITYVLAGRSASWSGRPTDIDVSYTSLHDVVAALLASEEVP